VIEPEDEDAIDSTGRSMSCMRPLFSGKQKRPGGRDLPECTDGCLHEYLDDCEDEAIELIKTFMSRLQAAKRRKSI
jgi:hypothetical protein